MVVIGDGTKSLASEMTRLGMDVPAWAQVKFNSKEIELGRQLIEEGSITKGKRISSFFVCTDCHLTEKEKPNFSSNSPSDNLEYLKSNQLDFLPATSFYGMINQSEYYSGDYIKKYGDLVLAARNSLEGAIQLCAQECSQGRKLTSEEVKYITAFLKSKELLVSDILPKDIPTDAYSAKSDSEKRNLITTRFSAKKENNFGSTDLSLILKLEGDKTNGKYIFQHSCMTCHKNERVSYYNIDDTSISKKDLLKKLNNNENELMSTLRYGTQPLPGSKAYMPLFTNEKLSDQQVADLIAYLNEK